MIYVIDVHYLFNCWHILIFLLSEQLHSRQKYREQREREERKREKKIIEKENRQIGIYPTPKIDIESYQHFPELQSELQLSK